MVGTVVFPTLNGLSRARSRRQQVAGLLLLPEGNGLVPWLPARAAWSAGAGASALVVDPPGGQSPGAAQPGQLQPGRALDSLSIRA